MMRKALACLMLLVMSLTVLAQDDTIVISWPPPVYDVAGTVTIRGTANSPDMQSYFLEAAPYGDDSPQWIPVSLPSITPVTDGTLTQWQTTLIPDGLYSLRLHVVLRSGESVYHVVGPLRIANGLERPAGAATATPALPTVEPTPALVPRPSPVNELPIPVGGQVERLDDETIAALQAAGMTWVKWQIPYHLIDDVSAVRDRVNRSHAAGFNVLLSIIGEVEELDEHGEDYYPLFAEYLAEVASLTPDAIEIWNEMNLDREWPSGEIDPRAYAEMLRQAYAAIKAVDPQITVISGALAPTGAEGAFGLARVWNDDRYYRGMANAGVADSADCIGVHYNEGIIPPRQRGGDPRIPDYPTRYFPLMLERAAFPFRGIDVPFCFTELGYLSPEGFDRLPNGFEWGANTSVREQSEWLRDAIQLAADDGRVDLLIVFNVNLERYDNDPQAGFAMMRPDGKCPACEMIGSLRGSA